MSVIRKHYIVWNLQRQICIIKGNWEMIKSTTVGLNDIESCKGIIKTKSDRYDNKWYW